MSALTMIPEQIARERLGCGHAHFWLLIKAGLVTPGVKMSQRSTRWPESEIHAVIRARIAGRTEGEIRELVTQLVVMRTALEAA